MDQAEELYNLRRTMLDLTTELDTARILFATVEVSRASKGTAVAQWPLHDKCANTQFMVDSELMTRIEPLPQHDSAAQCCGMAESSAQTDPPQPPEEQRPSDAKRPILSDYNDLLNSSFTSIGRTQHNHSNVTSASANPGRQSFLSPSKTQRRSPNLVQRLGKQGAMGQARQCGVEGELSIDIKSARK